MIISKKGIVEDITEEIGGKKIKFNLNFMSETSKVAINSYKKILSSFLLLRSRKKKLILAEYYYIPEDDIEKLESKIQSGDLIALTTSDKGLDIGHVGIAIKMDDGRIHFLHAPLAGSKVQITETPLSDYAKENKKAYGNNCT
ncbi:MAG: DUF1460 domain-containing protein [Ignavibacteriales bacterium]|nr:DUF1460 domain-containing protein [Ignavibacteriales bacterium]